jgi:hypothetical protein
VGAGRVPVLPVTEVFVLFRITVRIPPLREFVGAKTATGQFLVDLDRYVDG